MRQAGSTGKTVREVLVERGTLGTSPRPVLVQTPFFGRDSNFTMPVQHFQKQEQGI